VLVKLGEQGELKFIVERTFSEKGTYLTIKGADGAKYAKPQTLLADLVGAIAFDPMEFMRLGRTADGRKEQAKILRGLVKLDVDIDALDRRRLALYEERTDINRDLQRAKARADSLKVPDGLPDVAPDIQAITDRLTGASAQNEARAAVLRRQEYADAAVHNAQTEIAEAETALREAQERLDAARKMLEVRKGEQAKAAEEIAPAPADAVAIRAELDAANRIADGLRAQQAKIDADAEVTTYTREAEAKTEAIEAIDAEKAAALANAKMPVDGLGFADGLVTFNGIPLDQASSAQQLQISAAIGAAANPKLRVLLARDGSLLDSKSLALLGEFAAERDLQIWLERVDESGEVGIVMEDGHVKGQEALVAEHEKAPETAPDTPAQPDEGRTARAREYLADMLTVLATRHTIIELDKDNATVKVKLKNFPDMIAQQWTPAYLERVKVLTPKKK
jgi:hypothetical protein